MAAVAEIPVRALPPPDVPAPLAFDSAHPAARAFAERTLAIGAALDCRDPIERRRLLDRVCPTAMADAAMAMIQEMPARGAKVWDTIAAQLPPDHAEMLARGDLARQLDRRRRRYVLEQLRGHFVPGRCRLTVEGTRRLFHVADVCAGLDVFFNAICKSGFGRAPLVTSRRLATAMLAPIFSISAMGEALQRVEPERNEVEAARSMYDQRAAMLRDGWTLTKSRRGRPRIVKTETRP